MGACHCALSDVLALQTAPSTIASHRLHLDGSHLACWAGHIDATLALLRTSDTRDLYVQDYDVRPCSHTCTHSVKCWLVANCV